MEILKEILHTLPENPIPVRKVVVGVHWTLVASKYCALASTMIRQDAHGHSRVRDVGTLHEKSAQELAQWVLSDNFIEASIGMGAINSMLDLPQEHIKQINAADIIKEKSLGKNLTIVGHFPFVDQLKSTTNNCWVIEKRPHGDDFPEEAAQEFIPQSDVVAITGTAFVNHTIEGLLSLCKPQSLVIVLGSSTPMSPILFKHGISYLSGSRVIDEEAAILTIQQGASFPQVKGTSLLTMTNKEW
jgi:uncharacterized protein